LSSIVPAVHSSVAAVRPPDISPPAAKAARLVAPAPTNSVLPIDKALTSVQLVPSQASVPVDCPVPPKAKADV